MGVRATASDVGSGKRVRGWVVEKGQGQNLLDATRIEDAASTCVLCPHYRDWVYSYFWGRMNRVEVE